MTVFSVKTNLYIYTYVYGLYIILFVKGFFTNHSLRATAATRLYHAGVDEQLITQKTGHRSTAVRAYKRTSSIQEEMVSKVVQGKQRKGRIIIKYSKPCIS